MPANSPNPDIIVWYEEDGRRRQHNDGGSIAYDERDSRSRATLLDYESWVALVFRGLAGRIRRFWRCSRTRRH